MLIRPGADTRPWTSTELRALDALAVETYGIPSLVMMEHAGAGAAREIHAWLERRGVPDPAPVVILAGPGNNGGDGFVVARWLALFGRPVRVLLCAAPERLRGDARLEHAIARAAELEFLDQPAVAEVDAQLARCGAAVDALLGTGSQGPPREPIAAWIEALNQAGAAGRPVAALDLPSGLDPDSGGGGAVVRTGLTVSFAAPKPAFWTSGGKAAAGEVVVVPIGAPLAALRRG